MPRRKLSEYRAKILISEAIGVSYVGWSVLVGESPQFDVPTVPAGRYVVKVDQAVKGRFKKGLVLLDIARGDLRKAVLNLHTLGYRSFLIEPHIKHHNEDERYLALSHDRNGYVLSWSTSGGVDVESHSDSIESTSLDENTNWKSLAKKVGISSIQLHGLLKTFQKNYFVFLEINPYLTIADELIILDCAAEVDDAGMYFTRSWTEDDIRTAKGIQTTAEEVAVRTLDANSSASFNLNVLNPDGAVFLLLSGGGASVVIADEVYNQGYGQELANYGEYSGNPNSHESYIYTAEVIKLLLASGAKRKVLFIGGAVANFTDIANTFAGVIQAIDEYAMLLKKQEVKIYVRRGGPRQEIGLARMCAALEKYDLLGGVYDPSTTITDALDAALKGLKK